MFTVTPRPHQDQTGEREKRSLDFSRTNYSLPPVPRV
jgi:hypothetical protein